MIKNERIKTYPASQEQMEKYIASETDEELKKAYGEMLEGCLAHPEEWDSGICALRALKLAVIRR